MLRLFKSFLTKKNIPIKNHETHLEKGHSKHESHHENSYQEEIKPLKNPDPLRPFYIWATILIVFNHILLAATSTNGNESLRQLVHEHRKKGEVLLYINNDNKWNVDIEWDDNKEK